MDHPQISKSAVCPKCYTQSDNGLIYCPGCGYHFETGLDGVGPFTFHFPEVKEAYQPSGKSSMKSNYRLFLTGVFLGCFGGVLLYLAHYLLNIIIANTAGETILGLVLIWALPIIASLFGAMYLANGINYFAKLWQNRNRRIIKIAGIVAAIGGTVLYILLRIVLVKEEAFDSDIDIMKIVFYIGTFILAMPIFSGDRLAPYCEQCETYMMKFEFKYIPKGMENMFMVLIEHRQFGELIAYLNKMFQKNDENFFTVIVWYCEKCKEIGFVNVWEYQTRYEYRREKTTKCQSRLVFSSQMSAAEVRSFAEQATNYHESGARSDEGVDSVTPVDIIDQFAKNTYRAWASGKLSKYGEKFEKEANESYYVFKLAKFNISEGNSLDYFCKNCIPEQDEFLIETSDSYVLTNVRLIINDYLNNSFKEIYFKDVASMESKSGWTASMVFKMKSGNTIEVKKLDELPTLKYFDELIAS